MSGEKHLLLLIEYRQGKPLKEPSHVEEIGAGLFRLLASQGLVQGIAAGDEFRLLNDDGAFEVITRGGNLAIQVYSRTPVAPQRDELAAQVQALGGWLDGAIQKGLVFTVPIAAGFPAVEALFNDWAAAHEGWEWYFGNVYDPADGITPLQWW